MGTNCCPKPLSSDCYNGTGSHQIPSWYEGALKNLASLAGITTCVQQCSTVQSLALSGQTKPRGGVGVDRPDQADCVCVCVCVRVCAWAGAVRCRPASLYPQDMLDTVKTDLFAVNQMVATWDVQCAYEGQPSGNILQVACSERGNYFKDQYMCVQYPDLCNPAIIAAWWAPAQAEYVSLYRGASAKNKNGGGGFFHQVPACPDIVCTASDPSVPSMLV
jgi:hypothetical protein